MTKQRLDQALVQRALVSSRSQAESYIKLGLVRVNNQVITKAGSVVNDNQLVEVTVETQYVGRAALKLASVAEALELDFNNQLVLDVGSSTGGFTQYAIMHGATKVIAIEIGSNQLHPRLHDHPQIELHEKTDIRDFRTDQQIDIVVADVSFVSLQDLLPSIAQLCNPQTQLVMMVKPQFEAQADGLKHKGVIKNDHIRRDILKNFEMWTSQHGFTIVKKADSAVAGAKGNRERFYLLRVVAKTATN